MPTTVIAYGNSVFGSRTDLTTIEISAQITKIGSSCFYGCTKLTSIVIRATTPPTLGNGSVFDNTNNATIYVPQGTLSAYQSASYWSEYASRMQESA